MEQTTNDSRLIITVPDLAAVDLTELVNKELKLMHLDPDYELLNFYRGNDRSVVLGRGKRFEALIWNPGLVGNDRIRPQVVREHFKTLGFYGHIGAFTQWCRVCGLKGSYGSVPEDNECFLTSHGLLCFPYYFFVDDRRVLTGRSLSSPWGRLDSYVGFRELTD